MKRKLSMLAIVALTAVLMPGGLLSPVNQVVGACGWYEFWGNAVDKGTPTTEFSLADYYDGCHNHYYISRIQTLNGSSIPMDAEVRVWVCGSYKGQWTSGWRTTNYQSVTSGQYNYPIQCGPQSDNYNSQAAGVAYPTTNVNEA
jgi:hypothetical protein